MSAELFPSDAMEQLSPKLTWIKKHDVITYCFDRPGWPITWHAGLREWWPGLDGIDFFAKETAHNGDIRVTEEDTEDEALTALAIREGIPHWSIETP